MKKVDLILFRSTFFVEFCLICPSKCQSSKSYRFWIPVFDPFSTPGFGIGISRDGHTTIIIRRHIFHENKFFNRLSIYLRNFIKKIVHLLRRTNDMIRSLLLAHRHLLHFAGFPCFLHHCPHCPHPHLDQLQ